MPDSDTSTGHPHGHAHDHPHDHASPPPPGHGGPGIPRVGRFDGAAFELAVADLLRACGLPTDGVHTGKTARRVRELWERRLLGGYALDPAEVLGPGFDDPREDMVVVRGIAVHGVCPHHLVPFRGVAHVAYVPGGRLHGFGRIARLVDAIGHRLTYQEWMTRDIADALRERDIPFVVAEQHRELVEDLRRGGTAAVSGDATDPAVLIQAHVADAAMLVITTPDTLSVRKMVETARLLNPPIEVVVRTYSADESELLRQEQVGTVFFGDEELAKGMLAHVLQRFDRRPAT